MPRYFSDELLRRLRNDIPVAQVLEQLDWPHKQRDGRFVFLCPACREYLTATNPRTNLGRSFACERTFNPIDLVMLIEDVDFVTAVQTLQPHLPPTTSS